MEAWMNVLSHYCVDSGCHIAGSHGLSFRPASEGRYVGDYVPRIGNVNASGNVFASLHSNVQCKQCKDGYIYCEHGFSEAHEVCIHDKTGKHDN